MPNRCRRACHHRIHREYFLITFLNREFLIQCWLCFLRVIISSLSSRHSIFSKCRTIRREDKVMEWKRFPHYCSFVRRINWLQVDFSHKRLVSRGWNAPIDVSLSKLLSKQLGGRWIETSWGPFDITETETSSTIWTIASDQQNIFETINL